VTGSCWQFFEVVRNQNGCHLRVRAGKSVNGFEELFAGSDVQSCAGLIQQQQLG
jgi:hypothetical protein